MSLKRTSVPYLNSTVFLLTFWFALIGCSNQGAVVFAPTPLPPDLSPLRFTHPTGVFTVDPPRNWAVYTQDTPNLASTAFTPEGEQIPHLFITVIRPDEELAIAELVETYQQQIRPDVGRYTEQERTALSDTIWRMSGVRVDAGGLPQTLNTFIEQAGDFVIISEVVMPDSAALLAQMEQAINTISVTSAADLEPTPLITLSSVNTSPLTITNVANWTTSNGVFFVTGEVANHLSNFVPGIPVRVILETADGGITAEATDLTMGYGIPSNGFAPFSLRFGQGQPAGTTGFRIVLGDATWQSSLNESEDTTLVGAGALSWTSESSITADGHLLISGMVSNNGTEAIIDPLAVVTVFDNRQRVIAAGFTSIGERGISSGQSVEYTLQISEMGGDPVDYIVEVQGRRSG